MTQFSLSILYATFSVVARVASRGGDLLPVVSMAGSD